MMGKILVPIDGSPNSIRGLEKAIEFARNNNSSITLPLAFYRQQEQEFPKQNISAAPVVGEHFLICRKQQQRSAPGQTI